MTDETGGTGGTCVLRGCVPKKLLHYVAGFSEELEDAAGSGYSIADHRTKSCFRRRFLLFYDVSCNTCLLSIYNVSKAKRLL